MEPAAARGTRRRIWTGVAAYLAIMLAVALSLSHLYGRSRDSLDEALGERLAGVAVTASYLVDGDSLAVWSYDPQESLDFLWLRSRLEQVRRENDLSELVLCDADGFVLVSAVRRQAKGDLNVYWDLDPAAVASAREGFATPSRLYRSGDLMQKSAHAPVWNSRGRVAGVITAEAEADFLDALTALRRAAWLTAGLVLAFLSLMAWLLSRQQRALIGARTAMLRQENLATMGRMTAGIAHEIRNPLGIIRGAGEIQAQRLREAGIDLPTLDYIPDEVDRLDRILTRYLTFGTPLRAPGRARAGRVRRGAGRRDRRRAAHGVRRQPQPAAGHAQPAAQRPRRHARGRPRHRAPGARGRRGRAAGPGRGHGTGRPVRG